MGFYGLVLGILGVWRVTHLLSAEDGPGDILVRLRRSAGDGFWGRLLDCFYCLSLWTAAPPALYLEDQEDNHELLRQTEGTNSRHQSGFTAGER